MTSNKYWIEGYKSFPKRTNNPYPYMSYEYELFEDGFFVAEKDAVVRDAFGCDSEEMENVLK